MPNEAFRLVLELTQDEINELGELLFSEEYTLLYDKLVNTAGEAGADLP